LVQGGEPQTFGVPPPPQVFGDVQPPQSTVPPQPLLCVPQKVPHTSAAVFGLQTTSWQTFALQIWFAPQEPVPHVRVLPQPSGTVPQFRLPSCAHVFGWHAGAPHLPATPPPPHVSGAVQVPQSTVPPQPSLTGPQVTVEPQA
jgi:hypothetical protein